MPGGSFKPDPPIHDARKGHSSTTPLKKSWPKAAESKWRNLKQQWWTKDLPLIHQPSCNVQRLCPWHKLYYTSFKLLLMLLPMLISFGLRGCLFLIPKPEKKKKKKKKNTKQLAGNSKSLICCLTTQGLIKFSSLQRLSPHTTPTLNTRQDPRRPGRTGG